MDSLTGDSAIKLFGQTIAVSLLPTQPSEEACKLTYLNSSSAITDTSAVCQVATANLPKKQFEKHRISCTSTGEVVGSPVHHTDGGGLGLNGIRSTCGTCQSSSIKEGTLCKRELDGFESSMPKEKASRKPEKVVACPRCDSLETKFCYYNNYNVKQPRHFCKNCQRYWTAGGTLRNVPVGAGRRKNKHGIMMLHRHVLHENIFVRSDAPDTAREGSTHCAATTLSSVAQTLPLKVQFVLPSAAWNGPSTNVLHDCHEASKVDEPKKVASECKLSASHSTREYQQDFGVISIDDQEVKQAPADNRSNWGKGVNTYILDPSNQCCVDMASAVAPDSSDMNCYVSPRSSDSSSARSAMSTWAGALESLWAGASWPPVPCMTPELPCSWGVRHCWPMVETGECSSNSALNTQSSSSLLRKQFCSERYAANHVDLEGAASTQNTPWVDTAGQFENSPGFTGLPEQCSVHKSVGLHSSPDILVSSTSCNAFFPTRQRKNIGEENELLSGRHLNPAAMLRSMAFQETL